MRSDDFIAVTNLIGNYAWLLDSGELDDFWDLWHAPEARMILRQDEYAGRDQIIGAIESTYSHLRWLRRFITNPVVRIPDGSSSGSVRCHFQLVGLTNGGGEVLASGTYEFSIRKINERWKFTQLIIKFDHYTRLELTKGWGGDVRNG